MNTLLYYLIPINLAAFLLMGTDKWKAKHQKWRIPEKTLLGIALLGGSFGATAAMVLFRHKTRHPRFAIGLPVFCVLHLALLGWFFLK